MSGSYEKEWTFSKRFQLGNQMLFHTIFVSILKINSYLVYKSNIPYDDIGIFWKSHQTNKKRTNFQLSWTTILECLGRLQIWVECSWYFAIAFSPLSLSLLHKNTTESFERIQMSHSMEIFKLFDEWAQRQCEPENKNLN